MDSSEITPNVINKYVSDAARKKSISDDFHFAVLIAIPKLLHYSIEAETHPNFLLHGEKKDVNKLKYDKNLLMHILYGAVRINNNIYRVKISAKEYPNNEPTHPYSYEVQDIGMEIESLNPIDGKARSTDRESNNSISGAKLLKDVEMSYDSGKKLLDESKKVSESEGNGKVSFSLRNRSDNYEQRLADWKERNGLAEDAAPMEKPVQTEGESAMDFMSRIVEWTKDKNLWKTAPKPVGYWEALEQWKQEHGIPADEFPPTRPRRQDYETEEGYDRAIDQYNREREKWQAPQYPNEADYPDEIEFRKAVERWRREKEEWTDPPKGSDNFNTENKFRTLQ